jgi:hypothetical protein
LSATRPSLVVALLAFAACPAPKSNTLVDARSKLADVGAPHVAIFVHTDDGIYKVFLDTGQSEQLTTARDAYMLDATTIVHVEDGHYVVERGSERRVISGIEAPNGYPQVAPNGKLLAHTLGDAEIVTVDVDTGEARHYLVPAQGPQRVHLAITFTPQSDAIVFSQDGYFRLDLASGAITPADKIDYEAASKRPDPLDCNLRGLRMEERTHKHHQQILLIPTASATDPEHLSGTETRVLVSATDHDGPHGDGAITMTWKQPGPLSAQLFTPSCEHFVFTLEGSVYVGNIATGKFARVTRGESAFIK